MRWSGLTCLLSAMPRCVGSGRSGFEKVFYRIIIALVVTGAHFLPWYVVSQVSRYTLIPKSNFFTMVRNFPEILAGTESLEI